MIRQLQGFSEVADDYDGFIVDLWGVIHDGVRPYPAAIDVLNRLQGRKILLLSNAPRRAQSARNMLRRMGVPDALYTDIITSGEAAWLALRDRIDPWFERLGRNVYHYGPLRDRGILDGLDLDRVDAFEAADFIVNTGPADERDTEDVSMFESELAAFLRRGLPMVCANPDLTVMRAGTTVLCAGALGEAYSLMGGDVRFIGKPLPAVYTLALDQLALPVSRVVAIGDSLRTDVAGANQAGIDAIWILDGIHEHETRETTEAHALAQRAGIVPYALMQRLAW